MTAAGYNWTRHMRRIAYLLALFMLLPAALMSQTLRVTTMTDELDADADSANGSGTSLREAITYGFSGTTIQFSPVLLGTIFLEDSLGELVADSVLTITGPGASVLEVDGNEMMRVLRTLKGSDVTISGLTFSGGRAVEGAAIFNAGTLSLTNTTLRASVALHGGGALLSDSGSVTISMCRFDNNTAYQDGGAILTRGGSMTVSGTEFTGNASGWNGGAFASMGGGHSISQSTFQNNTASIRGGAVYHSGGTLVLTQSFLTLNIALTSGGAMQLGAGQALLHRCSFLRNTTSGSGGAINVGGGELHMRDCNVEGNRSEARGGGVHFNATTDSLIVLRSTFHRNEGLQGGALFLRGLTSMTNSTVTKNSAISGGGGIYNTGSAGIVHSTITGNSTAQGGGVYNSGTLAPYATIFSDNDAPVGPEVSGSVSSSGYNLVTRTDGSSGWIASDTTGTDADPIVASLDALRDNGGYTLTQALRPCSPAIDGAGSGGGSIPAVDQRNMTRGKDGDGDGTAQYDIGAYEAQSKVDVEGPQLEVVPLMTVTLDPSGARTIHADTLVLFSYDNCTVKSTVLNGGPADSISFDCTDAGDTISVSVTVTDFSQNSTTKYVDVVVEDPNYPTISGAGDVTVTASSDSCTVFVDLSGVTASDECSGVTLSRIPSSSMFSSGATVVMWTATDASGNVTEVEQIVTVNDTTAPSVTAPADLSLSAAPGDCSVSVDPGVLGTATAADSCGIAALTNDAPASFPAGTTTVTWTAIDPAGNIGTAVQLVTVVDSIPPTIYPPPDLSLGMDVDSCTRTVSPATLGMPNAYDNCSNITVTNDAPASFGAGITIVTWTATDTSGNSSSAQQQVNIVDIQSPVLIAPPDLSVNVDPGTCYWTVDSVTLGSPSVSDNCGTPTVTSNVPATLTAGKHNIVWQATDAGGNKKTVVQKVTVLSEMPTITCQADTTVYTDPGMPGAVVVYPVPVGNSSCPGAETIRTSGLGSGSFFPVGTTTETYMVTDASGQYATCSFDVTVVDNEVPTITVDLAPSYLWPSDGKLYPIEATVEIHDNVPGVTAVLTSITSNQNINGDVSDASFGVFDDFYQFRAKRDVNGPRFYYATYTATDLAGNTAVATDTVEVPTHQPKDFETEPLPAPEHLVLEQNYPNPFNPTTVIAFGVPVEQHVELRVYDAMGRAVRTLVSSSLTAGTYSVTWDGRSESGAVVPSGVYLYTLTAGDTREVRKMLLSR